MTDAMNRRLFLGTAAATGLAYGLAHRTLRAAADSPNEQIVVGVMGTGGRGTTHSVNFSKFSGVQVAYVCDVDEQRAGQAAGAVEKAAGKKPDAVTDFRRILDDKDVDALVVATCNHWHAPAAILGCKAGKHVYVEKPCSHNPREGELLVEAARKYDKRVQMGNQRRSWPGVVEAIQKLHDGVIGRVYMARGFYRNLRPSIGHGKEVAPPKELDWDLWQGPAPRKPFHDNYVHYNWHWFWHWGNGEIGNNGVHFLDVCRWGLGVDFPTRVTSAGGRYRWDDDQETPDTHEVSFDFPDQKTIAWHGLSCNKHNPGKASEDVVFIGENGTLVISGAGYTIFDINEKVIGEGKGAGGDNDHVQNFLDAIRTGKTLNSEIGGGHISTTLCHLGNIAHRTGRTINCDPKTGHIQNDREAMDKYWSRQYEPGWEPKV